MSEPFALAEKAAAALVEQLGGAPDMAVVLGSGWSGAVALLGEVEAEASFDDLPGFPTSTVPGHGGSVTRTSIGDKTVAILQGRVHLYEGHAPARVVHGVRTAILSGAKTVLLTNAAGSLNAEFGVGKPVLIRDHLNLTAQSPLTGGPPPEPYAIRFVDLTETYSARLRSLAHRIDDDLGEGVYAGLPGPHYETPAEITMLQTLGADMVGMSTVLEAIAARHLGAEVACVSLVTNLAAGLGDTDLDHSDVVAAGAAAGTRVGTLLAELIRQS